MLGEDGDSEVLRVTLELVERLQGVINVYMEIMEEDPHRNGLDPLKTVEGRHKELDRTL